MSGWTTQREVNSWLFPVLSFCFAAVVALFVWLVLRPVDIDELWKGIAIGVWFMAAWHQAKQ